MVIVERTVLAVVSDKNPRPAVRLLVDVRPGGAKFSIFEGDDGVVNAFGVGRCLPFTAVRLHKADAAVPADTAAQLGRARGCGAERSGVGRASVWDVEEREGEGVRVGRAKSARGRVGRRREESAWVHERGGALNAGTAIRVCEGCVRVRDSRMACARPRGGAPVPAGVGR